MTVDASLRIATALMVVVLLAGCFGPQDRRPGMWLPGEVAPTPTDWSFVADYPEIAIEVRTPYFLRHSVTIVSSPRDGDLFIGALNPEGKSWPGWADRDPDVRLGIGDRVYEVRIVPVTEPDQIERILGGGQRRPPEDASIRFWQVQPRPAEDA